MSSLRVLPAALAAAALLVVHPAATRADGSGSGSGTGCSVVNLGFTPAANLQIVAWIEDTSGTFIDTVYITKQTGSYGIGNRPGRFDFNSGPMWPYGRRETTFPVWAHRHGLTFPQVDFQDGDDDDLSHATSQSSRETHFCRPLLPTEQPCDATSNASAKYTDKGVFSATTTSLYPPRIDVTQQPGIDSDSVTMYHAMNPFDAVSQATPAGGSLATISYPAPSTLTAGNYVMWVEVSLENDDNDTYNAMSYPAPTGIPYGTYGTPYRGQPSVVYNVPFTMGAAGVALGSDYVGYGDPDGEDGAIRSPDITITTDVPGSGAARLQLTSDADGTYRVKVSSVAQSDFTPPSAPSEGTVISTDTASAAITFVAPGNDGDVGTAQGYDIRVRANTPITDDNFDSSMPIAATVTPDEAGQVQSVNVTGLLPSTKYYLGIRAFDMCRNTSPLTVIPFTTADRQAGEVDACFVATAAYGSLLANDVEVLRTFRDRALRSTVLGELAVETYYTFGPEVAGMVGESELLRATARDALAPIVARVRGGSR